MVLSLSPRSLSEALLKKDPNMQYMVYRMRLFVQTSPFVKSPSNGLLPASFLPAAKPAGLCLANVTHLLDTWLLGALDALRDMLAQVSELARIKYDVS